MNTAKAAPMAPTRTNSPRKPYGCRIAGCCVRERILGTATAAAMAMGEGRIEARGKGCRYHRCSVSTPQSESILKKRTLAPRRGRRTYFAFSPEPAPHEPQVEPDPEGHVDAVRVHQSLRA